MLVHKSAAVVQIGGDFHFVMSDASVDRMGDVIESAGWDLTTFRLIRLRSSIMASRIHCRLAHGLMCESRMANSVGS
jgi:hypothetical protein